MFCRITGVLACATIFLLSGVSARANEQQLQALLAKYFISHHQAIPVHNNGNVKSGDVLKMPEEATYVSRDKCYNFPSVRYTTLTGDLIRTTSALAGELGGQIPIQKVADIEAELHAKFRETATILIDPLSQEEPPNGYGGLWKTSGAPGCEIIKNIWGGKADDKILVTRVFHGALNAISTFDVSESATVEAAIEQKKINTILGGKPHVRLKADGSIVQLEYSQSPDPQPLAVQSALVNFDQLAKLYIACHTQERGIQLEWLVYEYITGTEPGPLKKLQIAIASLLDQMNVRQASTGALYQSVLTGEKIGPPEKVSLESWRVFATVAAAHEIIGAQ